MGSSGVVQLRHQQCPNGIQQRTATLTEQQQVAAALEADAEVMSNTQLEEQLVGQPPETKAEIIRITPTPGRWHGRSPC